MSNSIDFLLVISKIKSPIYRRSPQFLGTRSREKFTEKTSPRRSLGCEKKTRGKSEQPWPWPHIILQGLATSSRKNLVPIRA